MSGFPWPFFGPSLYSPFVIAFACSMVHVTTVGAASSLRLPSNETRVADSSVHRMYSIAGFRRASASLSFALSTGFPSTMYTCCSAITLAMPSAIAV